MFHSSAKGWQITTALCHPLSENSPSLAGVCSIPNIL
jgi:hypothetical protein